MGLPWSCGVAHDNVTCPSPALAVTVSSASGGLAAGGVDDVVLGDGDGEGVGDGDGCGDRYGIDDMDGDGDGDGFSGVTGMAVTEMVGDGAGAAAVNVGAGVV